MIMPLCTTVYSRSASASPSASLAASQPGVPPCTSGSAACRPGPQPELPSLLPCERKVLPSLQALDPRLTGVSLCSTG